MRKLKYYLKLINKVDLFQHSGKNSFFVYIKINTLNLAENMKVFANLWERKRVNAKEKMDFLLSC